MAHELDQETFCADLREQLTTRTAELMADDSVPIGEKLKKLGEVTGRQIGFNVDSTLALIERSAREQRVVAALVNHPFTPLSEGVFLGYLDPDEPLELEEDGTYRINVAGGQIAKVFTTRSPGDGGKYVIASHFTFARYDPEPVPVDRSNLVVLGNDVPADSRSMTFHAESVFNQAVGLGFKIAHEGVSLPTVDTNGDIHETHDRLNVLGGLGKRTLGAMWNEVTGLTPVQ